MSNEKQEFSDVKRKLFQVAGLLDAQLRVSSENLTFTELETEFLDNWLKTGNVDPLLGSVIAQQLGLREMPDPNAGENDAS